MKYHSTFIIVLVLICYLVWNMSTDISDKYSNYYYYPHYLGSNSSQSRPGYHFGTVNP